MFSAAVSSRPRVCASNACDCGAYSISAATTRPPRRSGSEADARIPNCPAVSSASSTIDFKLTVLRGIVQWHKIVDLLGVHICAANDQHLGNVETRARSGRVQCGDVLRIVRREVWIDAMHK